MITSTSDTHTKNAMIAFQAIQSGMFAYSMIQNQWAMTKAMMNPSDLVAVNDEFNLKSQLERIGPSKLAQYARWKLQPAAKLKVDQLTGRMSLPNQILNGINFALFFYNLVNFGKHSSDLDGLPEEEKTKLMVEGYNEMGKEFILGMAMFYSLSSGFEASWDPIANTSGMLESTALYDESTGIVTTMSSISAPLEGAVAIGEAASAVLMSGFMTFLGVWILYGTLFSTVFNIPNPEDQAAAMSKRETMLRDVQKKLIELQRTYNPKSLNFAQGEWFISHIMNMGDPKYVIPPMPISDELRAREQYFFNRNILKVAGGFEGVENPLGVEGWTCKFMEVELYAFNGNYIPKPDFVQVFEKDAIVSEEGQIQKGAKVQCFSFDNETWYDHFFYSADNSIIYINSQCLSVPVWYVYRVIKSDKDPWAMTPEDCRVFVEKVDTSIVSNRALLKPEEWELFKYYFDWYEKTKPKTGTQFFIRKSSPRDLMLPDPKDLNIYGVFADFKSNLDHTLSYNVRKMTLVRTMEEYNQNPSLTTIIARDMNPNSFPTLLGQCVKNGMPMTGEWGQKLKDMTSKYRDMYIYEKPRQLEWFKQKELDLFEKWAAAWAMTYGESFNWSVSPYAIVKRCQSITELETPNMTDTHSYKVTYDGKNQTMPIVEQLNDEATTYTDQYDKKVYPIQTIFKRFGVYYKMDWQKLKIIE